jgi:hypothetical protein
VQKPQALHRIPVFFQVCSGILPVPQTSEKMMDVKEAAQFARGLALGLVFLAGTSIHGQSPSSAQNPSSAANPFYGSVTA